VTAYLALADATHAPTLRGTLVDSNVLAVDFFRPSPEMMKCRVSGERCFAFAACTLLGLLGNVTVGLSLSPLPPSLSLSLSLSFSLSLAH
jgi:hypothetical protein